MSRPSRGRAMGSERPAATDPAGSFAVLIGTSRFEDPSYADGQLPGVANNVSRLGWMLRDPSLWGLPAANCLEVLDPRSPSEIIDPIKEAAAKVTGTLLVYFAGHGLLSSINAKLYLTHALSVDGSPESALDFDHVRHALIFSRAPSRIMILDCCYAGNATLMGPADGQVAVDGTFVLAATQPNRPAPAGSAAGLTTFTGELVTLLRNGVPGEGRLLTMGATSRALEKQMANRGLPQPRALSEGNVGDLPLFRNWWDHDIVNGEPCLPRVPGLPASRWRAEGRAAPGILLAAAFGNLNAALLAGRLPVGWTVAVSLSTALIVYLVRLALAVALARRPALTAEI
ncbi:caspase family protein [Actinoplanes sp. NPDC049668]|uniref:caspase, EACC1-associated type n=1 Tax=unclassified Actinoplanes TaxID=2626549 RepID=UPI0033B03E5D